MDSNVIVVKENDMDLELLNLGMISSYYYISYTTIEIFNSSLQAKTKLKGLLDIVTAASELDDLPVRPGKSSLTAYFATILYLVCLITSAVHSGTKGGAQNNPKGIFSGVSWGQACHVDTLCVLAVQACCPCTLSYSQLFL